MPEPLLLLSREEVHRLLPPERCIEAVERAFRQLGEGRAPPPGLLAMHASDGSFHVKASFLDGDRAYFAAKLNANFPANGARFALPTIQGVVLLFDATRGSPLALMDSASITALRTAAATALAARCLALREVDTLAIIGCGAQASAQLLALLCVRRPKRVLACDIDASKAARFAQSMAARLSVPVQVESDVARAIAASQVVVTCTTARRFFVTRAMVAPGTLIAAVGADHEDKQEIAPDLLAHAKVVTDLTAQAVRIGDVHHAIAAGAMRASDVHAELGELLAGAKAGRQDDDEVIVFDSTGTGLQDAAAAVEAYRAALAMEEVPRFALDGEPRAAVTSP